MQQRANTAARRTLAAEPQSLAFAHRRRGLMVRCPPSPPPRRLPRPRSILWAFKLNPFEKLNLHFDATPDEIKKQFRKLSLLVHPDKCSHPQAAAAFDGAWLREEEWEGQGQGRPWFTGLLLACGRYAAFIACSL
jgi:hypothetical protein